MSAFTIEQLQARLAAYLEAETAILKNQRYTIGDRRFERADLAVVQRAIEDLRRQIDSMQAGTNMRNGKRGRIRYVVPT